MKKKEKTRKALEKKLKRPKNRPKQDIPVGCCGLAHGFDCSGICGTGHGNIL